MQRDLLLAEKRAEARRFADRRFSEVTPSRRDFTQFVATQKSGIALVPRLARADPEIGAAWPDADLEALARICDAAEIGAIAVRTADFYDGRLDDLAAVAMAVTAPVLHDEPCLHVSQVYHSRLHGADAVLVPVSAVAPGELRPLVDAARSVHMAAVLEARDERDLERAVELAEACIGLACPAAGGFADLDRVRTLAAPIPRRRTVLLLSEVAELARLAALDGLVDAAVAGKAILAASDPASVLAGFLGASG